jgi:hypothetical protein
MNLSYLRGEDTGHMTHMIQDRQGRLALLGHGFEMSHGMCRPWLALFRAL